MKRFILWTLSILLLAYAGLYLYTQPMLRPKVVPIPTALPTGDPVAGAHLAAISGCTSCHGQDMGGKPFIKVDYAFSLVAPDLTRVRELYDDAAFVRLFRTGSKLDGTYALGMPTEMQQRMTDQELADLIAYLRSAPVSAQPVQGRTRIYPLGRIGMVMGEYEPDRADPPESDVVLADRAEPLRGRHLALIACSECHGLDLQGGDGTPALAIAKAYDRAQFTRLLRTGITLAGTESASGMMTGVARRRFHALGDADIAALHEFLASGPGPAAAAPVAVE